MTTWRKEISMLLQGFGLTWDDVIACTLTEAQLDAEFDKGFGCTEGDPFTLWTEAWVLFPRCYDGAEGVASVPRNPCDHAQPHIGGG